ncbi:MAG: Imm32 family immunity protein [Hyphomicrobiaceae bacterium]
MKLTVEHEVGDDGEVAICFDEEGLDFLLSKLNTLRSPVGHLHLMTPSWAGNELTEDKFGGEKYVLVHSLRLVRLPESQYSGDAP